jgi:hypothetical protein
MPSDLDSSAVPISTRGLGETVDSGTKGALKRAKSGSTLKKAFSAIELRTVLADIKRMIGEGKSDRMIAEELGLNAARYNELKRELFRQETADLYSKSTEDVYLEYKWQQNRCIEDLDRMIADIDGDSKQQNALVGAIKARSEIIDKIVKVGQEMGVLERAPEKKLVIHGHAVAQLPDAELRKLIANELQGLQSIVSRYGERDMAGNLITDAPQLPAPPAFNAQGKPGTSMGGAIKAEAGRKSRASVKRAKVIDVEPE